MYGNYVFAVDYRNAILVYPEYTNMTWDDYDKISANTGKMVIGGYQSSGNIGAYLSYKGRYAYRTKVHLTSNEIENGYTTKDKEIQTLEMGGIRVLPIICKEILFPEDYYHLKDIGIITHHIGYPMYDRHQYLAWEALQKAAVEHFKCPLISITGGEQTELALTHILEVE